MGKHFVLWKAPYWEIQYSSIQKYMAVKSIFPVDACIKRKSLVLKVHVKIKRKTEQDFDTLEEEGGRAGAAGNKSRAIITKTVWNLLRKTHSRPGQTPYLWIVMAWLPQSRAKIAVSVADEMGKSWHLSLTEFDNQLKVIFIWKWNWFKVM